MNYKDMKFIILFIVITLSAGFYLFQTSYAKYRKQLNGNISSRVATWNIKVNNELVNGKDTLSNDITPVFDANEYVKENVIAPGSTGYYDLIIDGTASDVSFKYQITSTVSDKSSVTDLITEAYTIDPDNNTEKINYNNNEGITGTINHNSPNIKIRIYIKWQDNIEEEKMDNTKDTQIAANETNKAILQASIKFEQLKN